jgi:hypothetical protein
MRRAISRHRPWASIIVTGHFIVVFSFLEVIRGATIDDTQETNELQADGGLNWQTDYVAAYDEAKRDKKMLLISFVPDDKELLSLQDEMDCWIETDPEMCARMRELTLARLAMTTQINEGGKRMRLIDSSGFRELGGPGVAMLDLRDAKQPYYGRMVTALPFARGKYYRWQNSHLNAALELPSGSISQRTMIWAVRVHDESPASTAGDLHPALAQAAAEQSAYQAEIGVQGHHRWETRFHKIRLAARANVASEVVAESWPDENLIDACIDCVASWRHSPGHWQAVRTRHRLFGYDIRRGRNGIWYGTGIFAN